jgi:hypothetical protein
LHRRKGRRVFFNQIIDLEDWLLPVVLLDWQLATRAPPAVDLAWYLNADAAVLPISQETAIAYYKHCLARRLGERFDESWWRPQLELSLLGGFVRQGWVLMLRAIGYWDDGEAALAKRKVHLAWLIESVRAGARWL